MPEMTPAERTVAALSFQVPDRVPVFLNLTSHGARELGLSIREYFSSARNVVEAQLRMRRRFGHDNLVPFFYGALEVEAFGGEVLWSDDGPPLAGAPILRGRDDILRLEPPRVAGNPHLCKMLETISALADAARGEVAVGGGVIAPTSLPVMLLGFERYLDLLYGDPAACEHLFGVLERYSVEWANAQRRAGASAVGCYDPMASPSVADSHIYEALIRPVQQRFMARIGKPAAYMLASAPVGDRLEDVISTGAVLTGASFLDDLPRLKAQARGRIAFAGNLNTVALASWTASEARAAATRALEEGAPGGGFILSDAHGEVPFVTPDDVLHAIVEAARAFGRPATDA